MELRSVSYDQYSGRPNEWSLRRFTLKRVNLLVGRNAAGKSKALNIISSLANLLSGDIGLSFESGNYHVVFDNHGEKIEYLLKYENSQVQRESLIRGSEQLLDRGDGGAGTIVAKGEDNKRIQFQVPVNQLAALARRDEIQHPFFEDLYNWGKAARLYRFGTPLGQDHLALALGEGTSKFDPKEPIHVVAHFREAKRQFPDSFVKSVAEDMTAIGFPLKSVDIQPLPASAVPTIGANRVMSLVVEEMDLPARVSQLDMSQGMFRTLSLMVHIEYCLANQTPSCILIDDIGEGLDYERSTALIARVIEKVEGSPIQLIMSTNDQFVMNKVPLDYWQVVQRVSNTSSVFNNENDRERFEKFPDTGLSNFDFFTSLYFQPQHS